MDFEHPRLKGLVADLRDTAFPRTILSYDSTDLNMWNAIYIFIVEIIIQRVKYLLFCIYTHRIFTYFISLLKSVYLSTRHLTFTRTFFTITSNTYDSK